METKFKDVAHYYLNTDLKMMFEKSGRIITLKGVQHTGAKNIIWIDSEKFYEYTIWNFKPILRPMSDLTKPLEDGIIPIVELAKLSFPNENWRLTVDRASSPRLNLGFDSNSFWAYNYMSDKNETIFDQLALFQYLLKHHFNVFNISESEYIKKQ